MGMKSCVFAIVLVLGSLYPLLAQDIHFFHFNGSGPLLSPAEAGAARGQYRFSAGHRSQWASVTSPFLSNHFSFDTYIKPRRLKTRFGIGLSLQQDQAGDADFGTTGGMLSLNIIQPLNKQHRISIGGGLGFMQRKFDRNKLFFDEQFNGTTYDPEISPLDIIADGPVSYLDLSAGISWEMGKEDRDYRRIGLAVHHPNTPALSFLGDEQLFLDARWTLYSTMSFPGRGSVTLRPEARLMKQGSYYEALVGSWLSYRLSGGFPQRMDVEAGLFTRAGDALVLAVAGNYAAWRAAMSYELNYSGLRPASGWRGGWELNLVYQLGRLAPGIERKPACYIL